MTKLIKKSTLTEMGYSEHAARYVISAAKKEMVKQGFEYYNNKKLGLVPSYAVKSILGLDFFEDERLGK